MDMRYHPGMPIKPPPDYSKRFFGARFKKPPRKKLLKDRKPYVLRKTTREKPIEMAVPVTAEMVTRLFAAPLPPTTSRSSRVFRRFVRRLRTAATISNLHHPFRGDKDGLVALTYMDISVAVQLALLYAPLVPKKRKKA